MHSKQEKLTSPSIPNQPLVLIFDFHQTITLRDTKEEPLSFPAEDLVNYSYANLSREFKNYFYNNIREASCLKTICNYLWSLGHFTGIASFASQDHAEKNPNILAGPNQIKAYLKVLFEGDKTKIDKMPFYAKDTTPDCWHKKEHCQFVIDQTNLKNNTALTLDDVLLIEDNVVIYVESMARGLPTFLINKFNKQQFAFILESLQTFFAQENQIRFSQHLMSFNPEIGANEWVRSFVMFLQKNEEPHPLFYRIKINKVQLSDVINSFSNWLSTSKLATNSFTLNAISKLISFVFQQVNGELDQSLKSVLGDFLQSLMRSDLKFASFSAEDKAKIVSIIFHESKQYGCFNALLLSVTNYTYKYGNRNEVSLDKNCILIDSEYRKQLNALLLKELVAASSGSSSNCFSYGKPKDIGFILKLLQLPFSLEEINFVNQNSKLLLQSPLILDYLFENLEYFGSIKQELLLAIYAVKPTLLNEEIYDQSLKFFPQYANSLSVIFMGNLLCTNEQQKLLNFIKAQDNLGQLTKIWPEIFKNVDLVYEILKTNNPDLISAYLTKTSSFILLENLIMSAKALKSEIIDWLLKSQYLDYQSQISEKSYLLLNLHYDRNPNLTLILKTMPNSLIVDIQKNIIKIQNPYFLNDLFETGIIQVNNALVFDAAKKYLSAATYDLLIQDAAMLIEKFYSAHDLLFVREIIGLNRFLITKALIKAILRSNASSIGIFEEYKEQIFYQLMEFIANEAQLLQNITEVLPVLNGNSDIDLFICQYLKQLEQNFGSSDDLMEFSKVILLIKFFLQYLPNPPQLIAELSLNFINQGIRFICKGFNNYDDNEIIELIQDIRIVLLLLIQNFSHIGSFNHLFKECFENCKQQVDAVETEITLKDYLGNFVLEQFISENMSITKKISIALRQKFFVKAYQYIAKDQQFNSISEKEKTNILKMVLADNVDYLIQALIANKVSIDIVMLTSALHLDVNIFKLLFKAWREFQPNINHFELFKNGEILLTEALSILDRKEMFRIADVECITTILSIDLLLWDETYEELYPFATDFLTKHGYVNLAEIQLKRLQIEQSDSNKSDISKLNREDTRYNFISSMTTELMSTINDISSTVDDSDRMESSI